jgi:hypothetical protein
LSLRRSVTKTLDTSPFGGGIHLPFALLKKVSSNKGQRAIQQETAAELRFFRKAKAKTP